MPPASSLQQSGWGPQENGTHCGVWFRFLPRPPAVGSEWNFPRLAGLSVAVREGTAPPGPTELPELGPTPHRRLPCQEGNTRLRRKYPWALHALKENHLGVNMVKREGLFLFRFSPSVLIFYFCIKMQLILSAASVSPRLGWCFLVSEEFMCSSSSQVLSAPHAAACCWAYFGTRAPGGVWAAPEISS